MQIIQSGEVFDVVVVGSGATGGWMAKHLSEAGLKVALLEAGPKVSPVDFTEHTQPYDLRYRGASPEVASEANGYLRIRALAGKRGPA